MQPLAVLCHGRKVVTLSKAALSWSSTVQGTRQWAAQGCSGRSSAGLYCANNVICLHGTAQHMAQTLGLRPAGDKLVVYIGMFKLFHALPVLSMGRDSGLLRCISTPKQYCAAQGLPDTWLITWLVPCRGQGGGPHRPAEAA